MYSIFAIFVWWSNPEGYGKHHSVQNSWTQRLYSNAQTTKIFFNQGRIVNYKLNPKSITALVDGNAELVFYLSQHTEARTKC